MPEQRLYLFIVGRKLGKMFDVVDGEEDAIAPHGPRTVGTALATERATKQFYHKAQGIALMGNDATQWQDGSWGICSEIVRVGRGVAVGVDQPALGHMLALVDGDAHLAFSHD